MIVDKIRASSQKALSSARRSSAARFKRISGAPEDKAVEFFDSIVASMPSPRVVINMSEDDARAFFGGGRPGRTLPLWADEKLGTFERALGVSDPWYGMIDGSGVGERVAGALSLTLARIPEDSLCLIGDVERLFDAMRDDYTRDLEEVVCDSNGVRTAMAYSVIGGMPQSDAMFSPESMLRMASEPGRSKSHVILLKPPAPQDISVIVAPDKEFASRARSFMESIGKVIPVIVSPGRLPMREVERQSSGSVPVIMEMRYFKTGDRVAVKPTASMTPRKGVVSDACGNRVVVEWDDSDERTSLGLVEAMSMLMWEPKSEPPSPMTYSLPGMDEDTCSLLVGGGVDPVDLYSLASHFAPPSEKSDGWERGLINALGSLGIKARSVKGRALREGKFSNKSWIEGRVGGSRLVIDVEPGRIEIRAGNPWTHVMEVDIPVS